MAAPATLAFSSSTVAMPGMDTVTAGLDSTYRSARRPSSMAPPASGFMSIKPLPAAAQRSISSLPCCSTMLYGNMIVSISGMSSAASNTAARCAVMPICPTMPLAFASSSASIAPPGARMVFRPSRLGLWNWNSSMWSVRRFFRLVAISASMSALVSERHLVARMKSSRSPASSSDWPIHASLTV